ncbi:MAG: hypothetical protein ACSW73_04330, partial [Spirochaetales bacterium]
IIAPGDEVELKVEAAGENEVKYEGRVGVEDISLDDIMGVDMVEAALDLAAFDLNALAKLFGATYRTVTSKINGKNVSIAVLFGSFVEAINNFNY